MMSDIVPYEVRDYQVASRDAVLGAFASGDESTLLVLPTGTGKTVVAGTVVEAVLQEFGWRTLYLAHREELVNQGARTLRGFGFEVAIEMGRLDARRHSALLGRPDVVAGTVQTLQGDRLLGWHPEEFQLIIVDEAHHAEADSYRAIFDHFRSARRFGITATPDGGRGDLGRVFRSKCYEYSLRTAIRSGWLCRLETLTCRVQVDLREIRTTGGDYNVGDLESRIAPKLEQIARAIAAEHQGRPTVTFTPCVGSALSLAQLLTQLGVPAEYVAGEGGEYGMSRDERRDKLARFRDGESRVLVNCDLLVEGWDCPQVACIGIARPTRKRHRYCQMVGRGTRISPETGKMDCLILDFDWRTDESSKDLCASIDLYDDGTLDDEVIAEARAIIRRGERDDTKAIERAQEVVRVRKSNMLKLKLTGKEAVYSTYRSDPVGVGKILDIPFKKRHDMDARGINPPSAAQLAYLKALGMDAPEGISKWGASKMIDKLVKRQDANLAGVSQVRDLLAAGMKPDLARAIDRERAGLALAEINAIKSLSQGRLF